MYTRLEYKIEMLERRIDKHYQNIMHRLYFNLFCKYNSFGIK